MRLQIQAPNIKISKRTKKTEHKLPIVYIRSSRTGDFFTVPSVHYKIIEDSYKKRRKIFFRFFQTRQGMANSHFYNTYNNIQEFKYAKQNYLRRQYENIQNTKNKKNYNEKERLYYYISSTIKKSFITKKIRRKLYGNTIIYSLKKMTNHERFFLFNRFKKIYPELSENFLTILNEVSKA